MAAPEETPRHPPQPDTQSPQTNASAGIPTSRGDCHAVQENWVGEWGRGLGDRGSRAHQHPKDSWAHPYPYSVNHGIVETRQAMLHALEGCICPPPALPPPASQVLPACQSSNRAPGPRCWEQESTWTLRLGNSQGSGDMGGHRCLCQRLGAGGPECPWEKGQEKGGPVSLL